MLTLKRILLVMLIVAVIISAILAYMALNKIPFTQDMKWQMTVYQYDAKGELWDTFPATLTATQYDFLIEGHHNVGFIGNGEVQNLESDNFIFKLNCDGTPFDGAFGHADDHFAQLTGANWLDGRMQWSDAESMMHFVIIRVLLDSQSICFYYEGYFYVGITDENTDPLSVLDAAQLSQWKN